MGQNNPLNEIINQGKEPGKEAVVVKEDKKKLSEKIDEKFENIAANRKEKKSMKSKEDFNEIQEEVQSTIGANYIFMLFSPIIGFTVSPALYLLVLDIEEEQLEVIKIAIIGNIIGLILTVILVLIAFRNGIKNSILSVYRHFFVKKEISDLEATQIVKERDDYKKIIESHNEDMKELEDYKINKRVELEIEKRAKEKEE